MNLLFPLCPHGPSLPCSPLSPLGPGSPRSPLLPHLLLSLSELEELDKLEGLVGGSEGGLLLGGVPGWVWCKGTDAWLVIVDDELEDEPKETDVALQMPMNVGRKELTLLTGRVLLVGDTGWECAARTELARERGKAVCWFSGDSSQVSSSLGRSTYSSGSSSSLGLGLMVAVSSPSPEIICVLLLVSLFCELEFVREDFDNSANPSSRILGSWLTLNSSIRLLKAPLILDAESSG
ncbi:hypothetical protein ARMSODRAFT_977520 [Armillaria solidipes]|uniref:Uncharacterized protein n=1 Tax=Armillaria solidipes TaxID=1076256 RepID=A0A2H3BKP6_9AGAR|nr:hypothetical protein ARMSODRAFT_977520 [Armillaria solidipes]